MKGFVAGLAVGLLMGMPMVGAHERNGREVVMAAGPAFCTEDARLVPVWHHGYRAESVSGWVYTCKAFDNTNFKGGDFHR